MSSPKVENRTLFIHDNLPVMRGLNSNSVDLIATDPPFNSKRIFNAPMGSRSAEQEFDDRWVWDEVTDDWNDLLGTDHPAIRRIIESAVLIEGGHINPKNGRIDTGNVKNSIGAYLAWMAPRIIEMKRVLKPEGSIYLHCDHNANSYLKLLLDSIFGRSKLQATIIWQRTSAHNDKVFGRVSDTILCYGSPPMDDPFNRLPLDKAYIDKHYRHIDERGEWQSDDLTGPRTSKGESSKPWRDFDPAEHGGRCWSEPKRGEYAKYIDEVLIPGYLSVKSVHGRLDLLDKHDLIHYPTEGASKSESLPRLKRYLMPRQSRMLTNIWTDIPNLSARNKEYTNWSTQKPLPLYARMIRASSEEGNVVLDPFCGCATTCVAAEMLKRQWIGIDIDPKAEEVSKDRLRDEVDFWENSELAVAVKKNPPRRSDIEHLSYAKLRFTLWNSQAGKCANPHCSSRKKGDGTIREEDTQAVHRIPKSRGCEDDLTNRIGLCGDCNSRKSAKSWGEFLVSEYANLPIHGRM